MNARRVYWAGCAPGSDLSRRLIVENDEMK